MKRELGSDYESSENSLDYEEMGVDREEFERMVNLSKKLANINDDKEDDKNEEIKEVT